MTSHQKNKLIAVLIGAISALLLIAATKTFAQYNNGSYHVDGYWKNTIPYDSTMIPANLYLLITNEQIEIYSLDNDSLLFHNPHRTRALTFEYKEHGQIKKYYKWLIDMGSIIFYEEDGYRYLTKYTRNLKKLPKEYITWRISDDLYEYLKKKDPDLEVSLKSNPAERDTIPTQEELLQEKLQIFQDSIEAQNRKYEEEVNRLKDLLKKEEEKLRRYFTDSARQQNQEELKKTFGN